MHGLCVPTYGFAESVFHIHLRTIDDNDEIRLRDYLTAHPEASKEYETLKLSLLPRFRHYRDAYTAAESDFVKKNLKHSKTSGS